MRKFAPYFINHNLCISNKDVASYESFMAATAGNVGNSYIAYALIKELFGRFVHPHGIQSVYSFDFLHSDLEIERINSCHSHVIVLLQDQIRITESYGLQLPYDALLRFLKRIKIPIVVAGLGANSLNGYDLSFHSKLTPELVSFLHGIFALTPVVGVRGEFTADVLTKLGITNFQVIGCPTYYEMGPDRVVVKKDFYDLKKYACNPNVANGVFRRNGAQVFLQCDGERNLIQAIAFGSKHEFTSRYIRKLKKHDILIYSGIEEWKREISTCGFAVSTRVHGSILALNSGVPAMVMNPDSRAREMCSFLRIPYRPDMLSCGSLHRLYDACSYDELNLIYPKLFKSYLEFLCRNDLNYVRASDQPSDEQPQLELYNSLQYTNCSISSFYKKSISFARQIPGAISRRTKRFITGKSIW